MTQLNHRKRTNIPVVTLTLLALASACSHAAEWKDHGRGVNVNVQLRFGSDPSETRTPPALTLAITNSDNAPVKLSIWSTMLPGEIVIRCDEELFVLKQRQMWNAEMTVTPDPASIRILKPGDSLLFRIDLSKEFTTLDDFNHDKTMRALGSEARYAEPHQSWLKRIRKCRQYEIYFVLQSRVAASNVLVVSPF